MFMTLIMTWLLSVSAANHSKRVRKKVIVLENEFNTEIAISRYIHAKVVSNWIDHCSLNQASFVYYLSSLVKLSDCRRKTERCTVIHRVHIAEQQIQQKVHKLTMSFNQVHELVGCYMYVCYMNTEVLTWSSQAPTKHFCWFKDVGTCFFCLFCCHKV